ncbi:ATP-binding protein [Thiothrix lacustris]|uniref:ATP-binding protein n=1 Tax=Thiothrix lacustris TaxID=525917 RepID=UPI0027E3EB69|nr:ATP-binding protein [Thiothrix lacustris]WMP18736.1 ATP-binding protein [Thiothrix lacustris]
MKSIQQQLLVWLLGGILLATGLAGLAIYQTASSEANELFDYQLQQTAFSLPAHPDEAIDYPNEAFEEDIIIQVWNPQERLVYTSNRVFSPPLFKQQGFQTVNIFDEQWRIYTENRRMNIIQIAQPLSVRKNLATNLAMRSLVPLFLLIPIMLILASTIVRYNLRPLQTMTHHLRQRSAVDLQALPEKGLPTELATITHALNDLLARLDKAQSAQRAFVADAAHELRSPLTALKLQLQLAERAKTDSQRTHAVTKLGERLERAIHLTTQLLTLARQEASNSAAVHQPLVLNDLIHHAVADYQILAQNHHIKLVIDMPQTDITLSGNADSLAILLKNLLENALHYTPANGQISLQVSQQQGQTSLYVTDTGIGIAAEERQRVFDRFYRIQDNSVMGTGLGLSIVQQIAEQHGAIVQLNDNPAGNGLQVSVVFGKKIIK